MAGYKEPGFEDRVALAVKAREAALAKLKAKPAPDPAVLAERIAKERDREAAQAERAEAKKRAIAEKAAAAAEKAAAKQAEAEKLLAPALTEAELKAARDARYAARKARKSSR